MSLAYAHIFEVTECSYFSYASWWQCDFSKFCCDWSCDWFKVLLLWTTMMIKWYNVNKKYKFNETSTFTRSSRLQEHNIMLLRRHHHMKATTFCCCVAAAPYADETAYNLNINIYHHIGTGVWSGDKRATIVNNNFLYIAEPAVKNNGEVFVRAYRQRPSFCSFDMLA